MLTVIIARLTLNATDSEYDEKESGASSYIITCRVAVLFRFYRTATTYKHKLEEVEQESQLLRWKCIFMACLHKLAAQARRSTLSR